MYGFLPVFGGGGYSVEPIICNGWPCLRGRSLFLGHLFDMTFLLLRNKRHGSASALFPATSAEKPHLHQIQTHFWNGNIWIVKICWCSTYSVWNAESNYTYIYKKYFQKTWFTVVNQHSIELFRMYLGWSF